MTKRNQNFDMFAGDTKDIIVTMTDSTNLSGASVKWSLRRGGARGPLVASKTTSSGVTTSGTSFTVRLSSADTSSLVGQFYHEAEVTDVSGNVSTVTIGEIKIEPSGA